MKSRKGKKQQIKPAPKKTDIVRRAFSFIKKNWLLFAFLLYAIFLIIMQLIISIPVPGPRDTGYDYCTRLFDKADTSSQLGYASGIIALAVGVVILPLSTLLEKKNTYGPGSIFTRLRNYFIMMIGSVNIALGGVFIVRAGDDVELASQAHMVLHQAKYNEDGTMWRDLDGRVIKIEDDEMLVLCNTAKANWIRNRSRYNKVGGDILNANK